MEARPTEAKASLSSNRLTSDTDLPAFCSACVMALDGWCRREASGPATWP